MLTFNRDCLTNSRKVEWWCLIICCLLVGSNMSTSWHLSFKSKRLRLRMINHVLNFQTHEDARDNCLFCFLPNNFNRENYTTRQYRREKKILQSRSIIIWQKKDISIDPISISRFYLSSVKYHRPCWIILTRINHGGSNTSMHSSITSDIWKHIHHSHIMCVWEITKKKPMMNFLLIIVFVGLLVWNSSERTISDDEDRMSSMQESTTTCK